MALQHCLTECPHCGEELFFIQWGYTLDGKGRKIIVIIFHNEECCSMNKPISEAQAYTALKKYLHDDPTQE